MNRIKDLRKELNMTQRDVAVRLGVLQQAISKYEAGVLDLDTETIRRLCAIFGCTSDYLLGISARRDPEISPEDAELLAAYHAATPEIRTIVDTALQPYAAGEKITAAG